MKNATIQSIMSSKVISVDINADIDHIQEVFHLYSYNYLPVTEENRLVGIISRIDFISKVQNWNSHFISEKKGHLRNAKDFMESHVLQLLPDTTVRQAIYDMKEDKRGVICVVNEKQEIVGIVTLFDLINKYIHKSIYKFNSERSRLMRE